MKDTKNNYSVHANSVIKSITVKTPFGDTLPFITTNLVKQGTCLGPILNN